MAGIDEKTEAVARALCEHAGEDPDAHFRGPALFFHALGATHSEQVFDVRANWEHYREQAIAALSAAGVEFT